MQQIIADELEFDETIISVEWAHRLNTRKSPKPVIVKFLHIMDKDKVLHRYRENVKAH